MRYSAQHITEKKERGEKIIMLTAYDYSLAALVDSAGVDIVLVGDSLANVMLGLESTTQIGMVEMLHHAAAVNRAVNRALVVGDMPCGSYEQDTATAVANAKRFVDEAGCGAVKIEWFDTAPTVAQAIISAGIPVMGHVGLTPQTADKLGGFKVQGKDRDSARRIIDGARRLEQAGCFSVVVECVPDEVAQLITESVKIPTIGIGAGPQCDGQVLVLHDLLGLFERFRPKFVKQYADLASQIRSAVRQFRSEVADGTFPGAAHSFSIKPEELNRIRADKE